MQVKKVYLVLQSSVVYPALSVPPVLLSGIQWTGIGLFFYPMSVSWATIEVKGEEMMNLRLHKF